MAAKMETLDPAALQSVTSTVTYDPKSETVTLPGGLVSVAGITVVTGGVELSCGSCILAFGFWGTLIGLSCGAVGLWDQLNNFRGGMSNLLGLGLVILVISLGMVTSVVAFYLLTKKKREMTRTQRQEGKEVLVGDKEEEEKEETEVEPEKLRQRKGDKDTDEIKSAGENQSGPNVEFYSSGAFRSSSINSPGVKTSSYP